MADLIVNLTDVLNGEDKPTIEAIISSSDSIVHTSGDESITGVKTFSSSPIIPEPTLSNEPASKGYADSNMVANIADYTALQSVDTSSITKVNLTELHSGIAESGGVFFWDSTADKSTANAGTIIDPSVAIASQGTGTGSGCWIRQYSGAVNVKWFGAKGDYLLHDGSINPFPTDNRTIFNNLFSGVNKFVGAKFIIPDGNFYCSDEVSVIYQIDNVWLQSIGTSKITIEGSGSETTALWFPITAKNGITVNDAESLTNVNVKGISINRIGFDPNLYIARPIPETFDFTTETNFGWGFKSTVNGYVGSHEDIMVNGFYAGFYFKDTYNGSAKKLFTKNCIFGFLGKENTTLAISDSNFKGYHSCYASKGGTTYLENVVCEGTITMMETNPDLMDKFKGHGFYQDGGRLSLETCYSEKLTGYARASFGAAIVENNGVSSSALKWTYANTMSAALKAKIDIHNPDKITHYFKNGTTRTISKIQQSYMTIDEVVYIEDTNLTSGSKYTNLLEIDGSLPTSGGRDLTISTVFINHIPSSLKMPTAILPGYIANSLPASDIHGKLSVIEDYYTNYLGGGTFSISRRYSDTDNTLVKGFKHFIDIDGNDLVKNLAGDSIVKINQSGSFMFYQTIYPSSDNATLLGNATHRWSEIYAGNATINTSDDREKTYLDIEEKETLAAIELKQIMRKFKFNEAISKKGIDNARIHFGTSAQTVKFTLEKYGLDPNKYSFLCFDKWEEIPEIKDEDGTIIQKFIPAGDRYGIRYEELLCFIISAL